MSNRRAFEPRRLTSWVAVLSISLLPLSTLAVWSAPPALAATTPNTWVKLTTSASPSARYSVAQAYDPATKQLVLFGGYNNGVELNDTWTWDGTNWTQVDDSPHPGCTTSCASSPPARFGAALTYDSTSKQLVLFGGQQFGWGLNDTWTWSGTAWTQVDDSSHPGCSTSCAASPSGRVGPAVADDPAAGQLVLFGGAVPGGGKLGDTWTWNGSTWTPQSPKTSPSNRVSPGMAYDSATSQLVLFGGDAGSCTNNETWTWDGSNWTQQIPGTSPPPRADPALAYFPDAGQLVMTGGGSGCGGGYQSDTATWDGSNWTDQVLTPSPSARIGIRLSYDAASDQLVLFGGYDGSFHNDTWVYGAPAARVLPGLSTSVYDATTNAAWSGNEIYGASAYDTSSLTGITGPTPSGSVTYSFFDNGTCATPVASTSQQGLPPSTGTVPDSPAAGPLQPGSYSYEATYSGDPNYYPASSSCGAFSVAKAPQAALVIISLSGVVGTPLVLETTGGSLPGPPHYIINDQGSAGCSLSQDGLELDTTSAGSCVVTAMLPGNAELLDVSSAPTTVTFSPASQAPLVLTSTKGTYGSPLSLMTSGGSDNGAVSYVLDNSGSASCSLSGDTLVATSRGSCVVTATMAGNAEYASVSSAPTTVTFVKATPGVVLTLSPGVVRYGHEQVEHLVVTVTGPAGTLPTGVVTISGTRCYINLVNGSGTCVLAPQRFGVGTHELVATYRGSADFMKAASAPAELIVKATPGVVLTLSPGVVRYGHEQVEHLVVTVTGPAGTLPTGVVTISGTRCYINLVNGSGTCVLAPRRFGVGTHELVATYRGSADFMKAASAPAELIVKR
ncbi:MAG: kelch repeat-containing protein [Acidimicrobiales bacterium]